MEQQELIKVRLQIINSIEPKSAVEDVLFYRYSDNKALNIALLPIEGIEKNTQKEFVRKIIIRKLLSKSYLKLNFEKPELICDLIYFSIDSISEIDHCFHINPISMLYEYCTYDFNGKTLFTKSFKVNDELKDIAEIDLSLSNENEYFPSVFIDNFFRNSINRVVLDDKRTLGYAKIYGYSIEELRNNALEFGLTEFDKPYRNLSSVDKVNAYCYLNFKKHYFTTYALLERLFSIVAVGTIRSVNCVDIGCGPLTAGLALADSLWSKTNNKIPIKYYGIDTSSAMLNKAASFTDLDCFSLLSSFTFVKSLDELDLKAIFDSKKNLDEINIVFCSYLFASETLDIEFLKNQLSLLENIRGDFFILYQNSTIENKNKNWNKFKSHFDGISIYSVDKIIYYHNNCSVNSEKKVEAVRYEILKVISQNYAI